MNIVNILKALKNSIAVLVVIASMVAIGFKYLLANSIDKAFMTKAKQFACEISLCLLYIFLFFEMNSLLVFCVDKNIKCLGKKVITEISFIFLGIILTIGIIFAISIFSSTKIQNLLRKNYSVCVNICAGVMFACGIFDVIWFTNFEGFYEITITNCGIILAASVIPAIYWSLIVYALEFINNIKVYFLDDEHIKYEILYASDEKNVMVRFEDKDNKDNRVYILIPKKELVNRKIYIEKVANKEENMHDTKQIKSIHK